MLQMAHSAILLTFISYQLLLKALLCLFLSSRFTQVLLYLINRNNPNDFACIAKCHVGINDFNSAGKGEVQQFVVPYLGLHYLLVSDLYYARLGSAVAQW